MKIQTKHFPATPEGLQTQLNEFAQKGFKPLAIFIKKESVIGFIPAGDFLNDLPTLIVCLFDVGVQACKHDTPKERMKTIEALYKDVDQRLAKLVVEEDVFEEVEEGEENAE